MTKLSFVIPVYNSQNTIKEVVTRIINTISTMPKKYSFEIVLVNDNSKDNSLEVCKEIQKEHSMVKFINLSRNFGQHNALMAGFHYVDGEYIICLDDDLQTPPEEIPKLINTLEETQSDAVYAKYTDKKHSLFRKFGTKINDLMAIWLLKKPKKLYVSSFFITRRYVIEEMKKYTNPYPYLYGLLFRVTQNVTNVIVEHNNRREGKSNYSFKKLLSLWINGFTNYSVAPLRLLSLIGIILAGVSVVLLSIVALRWLFNQVTIIGWTSMIISVIFFGGVQLISLGFLGEYIGRIYLSINKTPQFVVKDTFGVEESNDKAKNINKNKNESN